MTPTGKERIVAAALLLWLGAGYAQQQAGVQLTAERSETYGRYVADADGRAVYLFTADREAGADAAAVSNCYDACAQAWPPVTAEQMPAVEDPLRSELVGTIERRDGTLQATYGGWPLYYYVRDVGAGEVTGQDVHSFGGEWYLLAPDGSMNERTADDGEGAEAAAESPPNSSRG